MILLALLRDPRLLADRPSQPRLWPSGHHLHHRDHLFHHLLLASVHEFMAPPLRKSLVISDEAGVSIFEFV